MTIAARDYRLINTASVADVYSDELISRIYENMFTATPTDANFIPGGFTYLAQMISHDIVAATGGIDSRSVKPVLTLESLYGDDDSYRRYDLFEPDGEFRINREGEIPDFIRDSSKPNIPEQRNDENALIAQMHLFWQGKHNEAVRKLRELQPDLSYRELISNARYIICSTFHHIVLNSLLVEFCKNEVYAEYLARNFRPKLIKRKFYTSVPLEFSRGMFRFGHSMVRRH